jgi:hypothetical protein
MMRARALAVLAVAGAGCIVAGFYLWAGLPAALIVGGVVAVVTGLLVDGGNGSGAG